MLLLLAIAPKAELQLDDNRYKAFIFDYELNQQQVSAEKMGFIKVLVRLTGNRDIVNSEFLLQKNNVFYANSIIQAQRELNAGNSYSIFTYNKQTIDEVIEASEQVIWPFPRPPIALILRVVGSQGLAQLSSINELAPALSKLIIDLQRERGVTLQATPSQLYKGYFENGIPTVKHPIFQQISQQVSPYIGIINIIDFNNRFEITSVGQFEDKRMLAQINSDDLLASFKFTLESLVDGLYQFDSPKFLQRNQLQLSINRIQTFADLTQLEQILSELRGVDFFLPVQVKEDTIVYRIVANTNQQRLLEALLSTAQLQMDEATNVEKDEVVLSFVQNAGFALEQSPQLLNDTNNPSVNLPVPQTQLNELPSPQPQ